MAKRTPFVILGLCCLHYVLAKEVCCFKTVGIMLSKYLRVRLGPCG